MKPEPPVHKVRKVSREFRARKDHRVFVGNREPQAPPVSDDARALDAPDGFDGAPRIGHQHSSPRLDAAAAGDPGVAGRCWCVSYE